MLLEWTVLLVNIFVYIRNDSSDPSGWIFIKEIDEVRDALVIYINYNK